MPSGDSYPDGEENASPSPGHGEQTAEAVRGASGSGSAVTFGSASGFGEVEMGRDQAADEESGGERSGGERAQDDINVNSRGEPRLRSVSANPSPGSTTGSGSTKSWKSGTGSSSCCGQDAHLTTCSEQAEQDTEHNHREEMQTVQEMKKRLPSEKKVRSKASTVEALNYALNCVKQVQANSEYYKLLMCSGLEERKDAAVCTLEQLESITSEHTLKNTDTFVVVFSLVTGVVLFISEQASSILHCKRRFLASAKFVELLFHQDVNVFYSHTAQPHLPPWTVGTDRATVLFECAQVKSFFCRIRGGKDRHGEMRYSPFRITPYLLKVQGVGAGVGPGGDEEQPCCLALAERVTSGYEAPRIPPDKRIFTSTHSPGCIFLEVDDRAVPLLGYLPQDLIGTSVLTCLHPEDRTLMLAVHRKIVSCAGQPPFEHSPVRFRCQNGDYVTLDTSWSSFINPWSRRVAFIIGRHKVRTGPLNEDVFAVRSKQELPVLNDDVKELQAMIYKLFLQPVHTNGSSGYSSLGSNGSHEHYISVASSSDSNGNLWEDTHREAAARLQQVCVDRTLTPVATETPVPRPVLRRLHGNLEEAYRKHLHVPSYQQINCVDSIIRYLESCSSPVLKRKSESLSSASSSSTSEEDKTPAEGGAHEATAGPGGAPDGPASAAAPAAVAHSAGAAVGPPLADITLSHKALSVVSITSQCSFSSTIVHVPQPESEVTALEDAPMGSESTDPAPTQGPAHAAPEELQVVGLTKEVLSAHTQKEEQEYVDRLRHCILASPYSSYLHQDTSSVSPSNQPGDFGPRRPSAGGWNRSHSGKRKHKRPKPQESSDSEGRRQNPREPFTSPDPNRSSSGLSLPWPTFVPPAQSPHYPAAAPPGAGRPAVVPMTMPPVAQFANPFAAPVVAVLLPYAPTCALYTQGVPTVAPPFSRVPFVPVADAPPKSVPGGVSGSAPARPPWTGGEGPEAAPPTVLFSSSRSSSPLQLNLLQEELPNPAERQSAVLAESSHEQLAEGEDVASESEHQDAESSSSALLDLLLHEDARSGTGSNASGSGSGESGGSLGSGSGSGSNGTSTSHTDSSNSSKYFASNDSSDTSRKARKTQETCERADCSLWSLIQRTPEPVMMTYQIRPRDPVQVLQEDREKLLVLQPLQPWFSQEQRQELAEVHPWIQRCTVPKEINTQGCVSCYSSAVPAQTRTSPTAGSGSPKDGPGDDIGPASNT